MKFIFTILLLSTALFSSAQNSVSTFAGDGTPGLKNGASLNAKFNSPSGICRDMQGNFYIADGANNCIRKINVNGIVSVFAGSQAAGYKDGPDTLAKFNSPFCVCADDTGNIYVSDFMNQRIRKITPAGNVSTIAGSGTADYKDAADTLADFNYPRGIAIDQQGNLYVADSWNHRIRKIDGSTHLVTTYAGGGSVKGVQSVGDYVDANDTSARFYTPSGVAVDNEGNVYVADAYNHRIRKIDALRNVTTIAGSGATGSGNGGFANGDATTIAVLNTPTDVCWTANGNLFIGDTYNNRLRILTPTGIVSTLAGNGTAGFVNGNADSIAEFSFPRAIVANELADSIWVVDSRNNAVRLITIQPNGIAALPKQEMILSPNPVYDVLHIQVSNAARSTIKITDNLGRLVYSTNNFHSKSIDFNTSNLVPGIYFATFETNTGKAVKLFIKL